MVNPDQARNVDSGNNSENSSRHLVHVGATPEQALELLATGAHAVVYDDRVGADRPPAPQETYFYVSMYVACQNPEVAQTLLDKNPHTCPSSSLEQYPLIWWAQYTDGSTTEADLPGIANTLADQLEAALTPLK